MGTAALASVHTFCPMAFLPDGVSMRTVAGELAGCSVALHSLYARLKGHRGGGRVACMLQSS